MQQQIQAVKKKKLALMAGFHYCSGLFIGPYYVTYLPVNGAQKKANSL